MEGTVVDGRYRVVRVLGRGACSTVYEAEHLELRSKVALKVLDRARASDDALVRFLREADAAARLVHVAAVRVFGRGRTDDGRPWIAMELLAGETLEERLSRGVLYPREVVDLMRPLCELLAEAHGKGMAHRDLKPSNIMLVPVVGGGWSPKLIDFGIAILRDDEVMTAPDVFGGTPRYMAPEQTHGLAHADARSDLYSLGVVAYECLAGVLPFEAEGALAWMNKHRLEAPRDLRVAMAGRPLPEGMRAAVMKALAKQPEDRQPSVMAFWAELAAGFEAAVRGDDDDRDEGGAGGEDGVSGEGERAGDALAPARTVPPAVRLPTRRALLLAAPAAVVPVALAGWYWRGRKQAADDRGRPTDDGVRSQLDVPRTCPPLAGPYMPLTVGSWWTYRVYEPGTMRFQQEKTIRLDLAGDVGGLKAGVPGVRLARVDGSGTGHRWLAREGDAVVWHRDEWYDRDGRVTRDVYFAPSRLRVDEDCRHRSRGARWTHSYQRIDVDPGTTAVRKQTAIEEEWSVEDVEVEVEVPAGRFRALVLRRRRIDEATLLDSLYWFAPGVGKVKEDSPPEEYEELVAYQVAP